MYYNVHGTQWRLFINVRRLHRSRRRDTADCFVFSLRKLLRKLLRFLTSLPIFSQADQHKFLESCKTEERNEIEPEAARRARLLAVRRLLPSAISRRVCLFRTSISSSTCSGCETGCSKRRIFSTRKWKVVPAMHYTTMHTILNGVDVASRSPDDLPLN